MITSTLLTLIVVPVLYSHVEQLGAWAKRRFGAREPAPSAGSAMPEHMPAAKD